MNNEAAKQAPIQIPERGITVLPNGKILAVLDIRIDDVAYIPANVYTLVGELCEHRFSKPARNALALLMPIFMDLLPNEHQVKNGFAIPPLTED